MTKSILVIRAPGEMNRILTAGNFEVLNLPLIETRRLKDLSDFEAKLKRIENYDAIFITSAPAAEVFADCVREQNIKFGGKVYVLGRRSLDILKTEKLDLVFDETANTAREMLVRIESENLREKRFLFVRGEKSLRVVPDFLSDQAETDEAIVYETVKIRPEPEQIEFVRNRFENARIAAVCFFSPSAAESFLEQFDAALLHRTVIATIGKTTADFFERRGLRVDFVSSKAETKEFASELAKYLKDGKRTAEDGK